ncbi:MAG: hypothetical protein QOD06_3178 [Candidatus Binatota bacterium]|nr:hypothetical protein [Candidatus Binatota bacterium]
MSDCPRLGTLVSFHEKTLSEDDTREVEAHVSSCPTCQQRIAQLGQLEGGTGPAFEPEVRRSSRSGSVLARSLRRTSRWLDHRRESRLRDRLLHHERKHRRRRSRGSRRDWTSPGAWRARFGWRAGAVAAAILILAFGIGLQMANREEPPSGRIVHMDTGAGGGGPAAPGDRPPGSSMFSDWPGDAAAKTEGPSGAGTPGPSDADAGMHVEELGAETLDGAHGADAATGVAAAGDAPAGTPKAGVRVKLDSTPKRGAAKLDATIPDAGDMPSAGKSEKTAGAGDGRAKAGAAAERPTPDDARLAFDMRNARQSPEELRQERGSGASPLDDIRSPRTAAGEDASRAGKASERGSGTEIESAVATPAKAAATPMGVAEKTPTSKAKRKDTPVPSPTEEVRAAAAPTEKAAKTPKPAPTARTRATSKPTPSAEPTPELREEIFGLEPETKVEATPAPHAEPTSRPTAEATPEPTVPAEEPTPAATVEPTTVPVATREAEPSPEEAAPAAEASGLEEPTETVAAATPEVEHAPTPESGGLFGLVSPEPTRAPLAAAPVEGAPIVNGTTVFSQLDGSRQWRIGDGGAVEASLDGGDTWEPQRSHVTGDLAAGSAPSNTVVWVVGAGGTVLRTVDGGKTWLKLSVPAGADLTAVDAKGAAIATVTTADGRSFSTKNGGRTWTEEGPSSP